MPGQFRGGARDNILWKPSEQSQEERAAAEARKAAEAKRAAEEEEAKRKKKEKEEKKKKKKKHQATKPDEPELEPGAVDFVCVVGARDIGNQRGCDDGSKGWVQSTPECCVLERFPPTDEFHLNNGR